MQDRINYLIELRVIHDWAFGDSGSPPPEVTMYHMLHKEREQITLWSECPYDGPFSDAEYKFRQGLIIAPVLSNDSLVRVQVRCQNCRNMVTVFAKMIRRSYGPLYRLEFDADTYSKMGGSAHRVLKI